MIEKRCFADRRGRCNILNVKKCNGVACSFLKTKEQYKNDREKALQRIRSLDRATQINIIENYYGGKLDVLKYE